MVEPIGFGANPETALDNAFQAPAEGDPAVVEARAREEFRALRAALDSRGIEVVTFAPNGALPPDAVFPNNWFSTHPSGSWILYPMMAPSRRRERTRAIVDWLRDRYGEPVDLTAQEAGARFLEGTGSLVIDEPARDVYASTSSRTDAELVETWAERFGYRPVVFTARDRDGRVIYHTNVVLTLGTGYAIACIAAIEPTDAQHRVLEELSRSGRVVIEIGLDQLHAFCANALELENAQGDRFLVMSERAWRTFTQEQRGVLEALVKIVSADLETIETYGGGSARCMLAELY
ncbi:MAG: arginine deiminase-related protein [Gemmatimonadota bacterium]